MQAESEPCRHPSGPWACSVTGPRKAQQPSLQRRWTGPARPALTAPSQPRPSTLSSAAILGVRFSSSPGNADPPTPSHPPGWWSCITQGALLTCRIVSPSLCCHLLVTGSAVSSARGSMATPTQSWLFLPGPPCLCPLSVFLLRGPPVPPASCKALRPLPPHTPRMASTVPPLSTSMEPEQTK